MATPNIDITRTLKLLTYKYLDVINWCFYLKPHPLIFFHLYEFVEMSRASSNQYLTFQILVYRFDTNFKRKESKFNIIILSNVHFLLFCRIGIRRRFNK